MAQTYTYDEFQKKLKESGLEGQFSTADLSLAQRNPDAGMSLLSYKQDYASATTPEARALANEGANGVRSSFGEYTAGKDGSGFYLTQMSPQQFTYGDAPTFDDKYAGKIDSALSDLDSLGEYSYGQAKPTYDSRYDDTMQGLLGDILGTGEFSYDYKSDPLYSSYAKQYTREGKRATADALGEAAAATGGMPSSYAVTAASQAGDYYASQLADKIPELYQIAYNKYLQDYQQKLSKLETVRGMEQMDYSKYLDELGQYNTDRDFDYAKWLDDYDRKSNQIDTLRGLRSDDMALYQTALGQYNTDREFDYGQLLDEIGSQANEREEARIEDETKYNREQDALDRDLAERKFAYSQGQDALDRDLAERKFAYSQSQDAQSKALDRAMAAAEMGDYSLLQELGISPDMETVRAMTEANTKKTSSGSSGGSTDNAKSASQFDMATARNEFDNLVGIMQRGESNDVKTIDDIQELMLQRYPDNRMEVNSLVSEFRKSIYDSVKSNTLTNAAELARKLNGGR